MTKSTKYSLMNDGLLWLEAFLESFFSNNQNNLNIIWIYGISLQKAIEKSIVLFKLLAYREVMWHILSEEPVWYNG